jgi:hypothetical protein
MHYINFNGELQNIQFVSMRYLNFKSEDEIVLHRIKNCGIRYIKIFIVMFMTSSRYCFAHFEKEVVEVVENTMTSQRYMRRKGQ